jgi:hypothetical protein
MAHEGLTDGTYRGPVKKQLLAVGLGLVVVLLATGQLARANAGPSKDDIQDSLPAWSSNGVDVAFVRSAAGRTSRILDMTSAGKSVHVVNDGILRGWMPGTADVLVQIDGEHTLLQGDSIKDRPLNEFLGIDASASPDGTRVAYMRDGTLYVAPTTGSSASWRSRAASSRRRRTSSGPCGRPTARASPSRRETRSCSCRRTAPARVC